MQKLIEQINEQIALFTENAKAQVEKNNKAAGTRARKAALELSKLMEGFQKGIWGGFEIIVSSDISSQKSRPLRVGFYFCAESSFINGSRRLPQPHNA